MRKALAGIVCLLSGGVLFAQCNQPNLSISGVQGEMAAPCTGDLAFTNASVTVTSSGGNQSGGGAGVGKATTGPLKVNRYYDSASPALFSACVNGKHFQTLKLSNGPMTITFKDVMVSSDNWTFNNNQTSESLEFSYGSSLIDTGGGTKITSNFIGTSRASSMSVAAVNGDGHSTPIQSLTLTARPGNTTFTSIQLAPPPPGSSARTGAKTYSSPTLTTALSSHSATGSPSESMSLSFGKIHFEYHQQKTEFTFTGGQVVNGNLRVSKASYTGPTTVAVHP